MTRSRMPVALLGIAVFAAVLLLSSLHPPAYDLLMRVWIKFPAPKFFLDWEWIATAVNCWDDGINVYARNPCYGYDPNPAYNYSPLWLRASFLGMGPAGIFASMFALVMAFFLSLILLPKPLDMREQLWLAAILLSSGIMLGIERGNIDILMFSGVMLATWLQRYGLALRLAGYALILLCAFLKFYPIVALVLVLRERRAIAVAVLAAAGLALAAFVAVYRDELRQMAVNLPIPSYFALQFAAANLPKGLALVLGRPPAGPEGTILPLVLRTVLTLACIAAAALIVVRCRLVAAYEALDSASAAILLAGATVLVGCFFAGQNVIYRGVFFLMVLPGLYRIGQAAHHPRLKAMTLGTLTAICLVMWAPVAEALLFVSGLATRMPYQGDPTLFVPHRPGNIAFWLANEALWWAVIAALLAIVMAGLLASNHGRAAARLLRSRRHRATA